MAASPSPNGHATPSPGLASPRRPTASAGRGRWPEVAALLGWIVGSWLRPADSETGWEQDAGKGTGGESAGGHGGGGQEQEFGHSAPR